MSVAIFLLVAQWHAKCKLCFQKPSTCTKQSVSDCIRKRLWLSVLASRTWSGVASPVSCEMDRHSFLVGIKMAASLCPLALSLTLNALNSDVCVLELVAVCVCISTRDKD